MSRYECVDCGLDAMDLPMGVDAELVFERDEDGVMRCQGCQMIDAATSGPTVAGQPAADRLMGAVRWRTRHDVPNITEAQVAVVLHALADHTALEAARTYRRSTDHAADFHPTSTAIGRWLHDVADQLEQR